MTGGSITDKGSAVDLGETPTGSIGGSMHGAAGGSVSGIPAVAAAANSDGGLMLPFDMDVPVAYSMASAGIAVGIPTATVNDLVSPGTVSAVGAAEDKEKIDRDAINAAAIMDSIETDRIPCPRLCGATFSFGVGGLAGTYSRLCIPFSCELPDTNAHSPCLLFSLCSLQQWQCPKDVALVGTKRSYSIGCCTRFDRRTFCERPQKDYRWLCRRS